MKAYVCSVLFAFGTNTQSNNDFMEAKGFGELTVCEQCESQIEIPFIRYFSDFTDESVKHGLKTVNVPIVIKFSNSNQVDSVGICMTSKNVKARRYIFIDKVYWDKVGTLTRKALVFHELAHCLLDVENHATSGIMSEIIPYDTNGMFNGFWKYVSENGGKNNENNRSQP